MWVLLVMLLLIFFLLKEKSKTIILGPKRLPYVGNLFSVLLELKKAKYHHTLWKTWSMKYGNLLGLRLGSINIVVVFGKEMIKEVSSRDAFDGRPDGFMYTLRSFGKKLGIVFNDGHSWAKTRRIALKYFKSFGYGSRHMEEHISGECKELVKILSRTNEPLLVNNMFDVAIVNVIWQLVAGKRLLQKVIEEHRTTLDLDNPRDVIDSFLIEMHQNKENSCKYITDVTGEELQVVCLDMFEAGVETVKNTMVFMLLYLVREQEVLRRLQIEIDEVVGKDRTPTLSDRSKQFRMIYTEAVILETLRITSVAPVGIPHMALADTQLGNYNIPKQGTFILFGLHDLHNGSRWKNPSEFRPERFLTNESNLMHDESLMPFGCGKFFSGKRRCIGENLAKSELFMFITHILQKFNLRVPDGDPLPTAEPLDGLTLSAKPFKLLFQQRN
ncbi:unnamed protein product [Diatraea saccharalis]|uniref:Cytochrome P450 n=1 Tax=Diatraea saccharalis TaxID=40085 RepID=A0A9N9RD00_9NEOP|nr:unnamed protein product [Diatraea saccharalis]